MTSALCENRHMSGSTRAVRRARRFIGLVAALAVIAVAGVVWAIARGERETAVPPAARSLWLPVPDVRGLSVDEAISRVEARGWRRSGGTSSSRRRYLLRAWIGRSQSGIVRPEWGAVACGSLLTFGYRLEVGVAKSPGDCDHSRASVPPFMAFRSAGGWVAAWGVHAQVELWSLRMGFRSVWGDLGGGSCERRARSRVFHFGGLGPHLELLRRSAWHLLVTASLGSSERDRDRDRGLCVTHRGSRNYVANHSAVRDDTVRRRASTIAVEVDFRIQRHSTFHVSVVPARSGRATAVTVRGPATQGSSSIGAHIRPGACRRVSGPETPFVISPDKHAELAEGDLVVSVPFAAFVARPHVVELHGFAGDGAGVEACALVSH
jgi:hypothetical protein